LKATATGRKQKEKSAFKFEREVFSEVAALPRAFSADYEKVRSTAPQKWTDLIPTSRRAVLPAALKWSL
jgi:hypothetical protein